MQAITCALIGLWTRVEWHQTGRRLVEWCQVKLLWIKLRWEEWRRAEWNLAEWRWVKWCRVKWRWIKWRWASFRGGEARGDENTSPVGHEVHPLIMNSRKPSLTMYSPYSLGCTPISMPLPKRIHGHERTSYATAFSALKLFLGFSNRM